MSKLVEVDSLAKSFGAVRAISDISFSVGAGEVFGLLGPNGAGKTTTLRILATLLRPDAGRASVAGLDVGAEAEAVRRSIGVVNGGMGLYDRLTGREILGYFGRLYGIDRTRIDRRIAELADVLELGEALTRQAGGFSTGMKQKIVIARAILHDPPVVFFDEATSGLDVMARRAVLDLVRRFASEGKAVVYSTHVMSEVEEVCDRLAIVFRGELVTQDTVPGLLANTGSSTLEDAFFTTVRRSGLQPEVAA
ncbi:MAG TPA: ATP-binding cassette domain-containing protein [Trueperaceae bacterium]